MEKRTLLAIILSMLILLVWSALMPKPLPPPRPALPRPPVQSPAITTLSQAQPLPLGEPSPSRLLKFKQDNFEVIFSESDAAIKEVIFNAYQSYRFPLEYAFFLENQNLHFNREAVTANSVVFTASGPGKKIIKRFIFHNHNYTIDLEIETQNTSQQTVSINNALVLGVLNFRGNQTQTRFQDATVAQKDKILHPNVHKNLTFDNLQFLGIRDRYFCNIIEPAGDAYSAFVQKINGQESKLGLTSQALTLAPGHKLTQKFRIYLGPQDLRMIKQVKPEWTAVMYYGVFNFIGHILLQLIEFLHRVIGNWGLAIIILSILIYFLLYPLTLKQMRSMKEMQTLQPKIEALKKTYKDNPQKLNKEIMGLYREHKVNPLGGCLPLVLQLPIFFALYQVLIRSVALKGARFLWVKDLSEPDRIFTLPFSIPVLGNEINILPVLMVIIMFIQQKITTNTAAMGQSDQQRFMLILMPLMFLFIFYHMPAGLVLYWFVNSLLMLIYQFRLRSVK